MLIAFSAHFLNAKPNYPLSEVEPLHSGLLPLSHFEQVKHLPS